MNETLTRCPDPSTSECPSLELLASRCRRFADLVESISRRRDVRETRSQLLLLLLELRCPAGGRPRRGWYVRGAVARVGIATLRRRWVLRFGAAPSERTIRAHLGVLERARAIVRAPGDWLPVEPGSRPWRPRHPDTIHLLEDEAALEAWMAMGPKVIQRHPGAKRDPDLWRRHLRTWRERGRQLELFGTPEGLPDRVEEQEERGKRILAALATEGGRSTDGALNLFHALEAAGVRLRGRPSFEVAVDPGRLRGAAYLLARALVRGDWIRNRAAWIVRAFRHAPDWELEQARLWAREAT